MKTKLIHSIFYLSVILLSLACDSKSANRNSFGNQKDIPKSIQKTESYGSSIMDGSLRWKTSKDIIERLFEEAMEKDKTLNKLNNKIDELVSSKSDSLKAYQNYANANNNYWVVANDYVGSIRDTVLRDRMDTFFDQMESDYRKKVLPYEEVVGLATKKSIQLNDQLLTLKLLTSLKMITKYQDNGQPNIEQLKNLNNSYDQLIEESQTVLEGME